MIPLIAKDWTTLSGIPASKGKITLTASPSGLAFDFPQRIPSKPGKACIDYLTTTYKIAPLTNAVSLNMTFTVETTGTVVFSHDTESGNTGGLTSNVRLFFASDTSNSASKPYGRWWANPTCFTFTDGMATTVGSLTMPLTGDKWSSVFGEFGNASAKAIAGFQQCLQQVKEVGMTFGGGNFYGHGINISGGTARFILNSYVIQ